MASVDVEPFDLGVGADIGDAARRAGPQPSPVILDRGALEERKHLGGDPIQLLLGLGGGALLETGLLQCAADQHPAVLARDHIALAVEGQMANLARLGIEQDHLSAHRMDIGLAPELLEQLRGPGPGADDHMLGLDAPGGGLGPAHAAILDQQIQHLLALVHLDALADARMQGLGQARIADLRDLGHPQRAVGLHRQAGFLLGDRGAVQRLHRRLLGIRPAERQFGGLGIKDHHPGAAVLGVDTGLLEQRLAERRIGALAPARQGRDRAAVAPGIERREDAAAGPGRFLAGAAHLDQRHLGAGLDQFTRRHQADDAAANNQDLGCHAQT